MNTSYEDRLEAEIDEALKGLPQLRAPEALSGRVMAAIARRAALPWYRQSWEMWPAVWRNVAVAVLLCSFGGLCFASWELTRAAGVQLALQELARAFSGVFALCGALATVLNGLVVAFKHIPPIILVGCAGVLALVWALFVGLGTACVKLAWARR